MAVLSQYSKQGRGSIEVADREAGHYWVKPIHYTYWVPGQWDGSDWSVVDSWDTYFDNEVEVGPRLVPPGSTNEADTT